MSKDREDDYLKAVRSRVLGEFSKQAGFCGATFGRRAHGELVRYQVLTYWDSWEAIRAFAGDDPDSAYVPREIAAILDEFDVTVRHYEVAIGHQLERLARFSKDTQ